MSCPGPIDIYPPLVVIVDPTDGSVVPRGTVEISATATDESDSIVVVRFFVDDQWIGSDSTLPAPYAVLWNTQPLTPASPHRLRVEAEDGSGNVGRDSVLVTIAAVKSKLKKIRLVLKAGDVASRDYNDFKNFIDTFLMPRFRTVILKTSQ